MKTKILSLILLLAGPTAFAANPQPSPSPGPADTAREINAQVSITQREIENVVTRIGNSTVPGTFAAKDYWSVTPEFRKKVAEALVRFQTTVKDEILNARAGPAMANYNAIVSAPGLNDSQRALILKQQKSFLDGLFKDLSARYREAANRAYVESGMPLYRSARRIEPITRELWKKYGLKTKDDNFRDYDYRERRGLADVLELGNAVPLAFVSPMRYRISDADDERRFYEWRIEEVELAPALAHLTARLRKECRSQLCFSLRSSDMLAALSLMQSLFSRKIEMKLSDGVPVTIEPPPFELQLSIAVFSAADRFNIGDLPFDAL